MFYDMMLIVESQGDLIDNIEHQVETAAVYISKGATETTKARAYAQSNRRMKWIICGIVTAVVVLLIIVILILAAIIAPIVSNALPSS
jgi:syntaxin 1A/syntaxin 1B/2/3